MHNDQKSWRAVLYSDYSAHFQEGKDYNAELQFQLYDQSYEGIIALAEKGPVLDLGCGKGGWLCWLKTKGFEVVRGIDLCAEDLEFANDNGIEVQQADVLTYLKQYEDEFTVIHAKDLIEHLDKNELVELGRAVLRALRPGGIFISSSFNAQAPLASATRYGDFTHEFGFTPTSMEQWLYACGFREVTVKGVHICPTGLKGMLRKQLYRMVNWTASFLITLRHGKTSSVKSDCSPDLISVARK